MNGLDTDVLVVGGSTAVANEGARFILAECSSRIGGVGTHSGIYAYYLGDPEALDWLLPWSLTMPITYQVFKQQ